MRGGHRERGTVTNVTSGGLAQGWLQGRWRAVVRFEGGQGRCWGCCRGGRRAAAEGREHLGLGPAGLQGPDDCPRHRVPGPGSPFRDEITLAILQLQENNRLEILKRKWWEGSRCPKEEDHRAKGQPPLHAVPFPKAPCHPWPTRPDPWLSPSTPRLGHGEHRRHFCRAHLWPHHCCLRGSHGIHMVHAEVGRVRRGEGAGEGCVGRSGTPGAGGVNTMALGAVTGGMRGLGGWELGT